MTTARRQTAPAAPRSAAAGAGLALIVYLALAIVYTWPLLPRSATHIASDPLDPILNTSILWWNATTVPFSTAWWNPPYFHPAEGVSAFTENLQGLSPIATPIYWLTRNPLVTYNITFLLGWALCAFATFLLVRLLTGRDDAAFVSGLAFGFTPYRLAELGHLQMLSAFWMPAMLLGLHGYLERRRAGWLALFGICWVLQSLANAYMMLFGAVMVGVWLAYFCSARGSVRAGLAVAVTWMLSSIPLVFVFFRYQQIHDRYGLRRSLDDPMGLSVPLRAWLAASPLLSTWGRVLPAQGNDLFPGVTAALIVACAAIVLTLRGHETPPEPTSRRIRVVVGILAAATLIVSIVTLLIGPWRVELAGVLVRVSRVGRPLIAAIVLALAWMWMHGAWRSAWARRSPLLFYAMATILMGAFAAGIVFRAGDRILLAPAPYAWLLHLPGFTGLRVPMRFWMVGVLCLAVAAGMGFARLVSIRREWRGGIFAAAVIGVLVDGWITSMPIADAPVTWPKVERRDAAAAVIELPLGPDYDAAATYRSIWHRRRVVNGVSGYDPAHYAPLQDGLNDRDPEMLLALASLGAIDVVVDGAHDPDGSWRRYASSIPGATFVASDDVRTAFRLPAAPAFPEATGARIPIAGVVATGEHPEWMIDGRIDTEWRELPQRPGQTVLVDLGSTREVQGVRQRLGEYARDFPRRLAIDASVDGRQWETVWEGNVAARAFLAAARLPREAPLDFPFAPRPARYVRLRQLASHRNYWRIAELEILGVRSRFSIDAESGTLMMEGV